MLAQSTPSYIPLTCCKCHEPNQPSPGCRPGKAGRGGSREESKAAGLGGILSLHHTQGAASSPPSPTQPPPPLLVQGPWLDDEEMPSEQRTGEMAAGLTYGPDWPPSEPIAPTLLSRPTPVIWAPEPCFPTTTTPGSLTHPSRTQVPPLFRQGPHQGSLRLLPLLLTCRVNLAHCSTSLALRTRKTPPTRYT